MGLIWTSEAFLNPPSQPGHPRATGRRVFYTIRKLNFWIGIRLRLETVRVESTCRICGHHLNCILFPLQTPWKTQSKATSGPPNLHVNFVNVDPAWERLPDQLNCRPSQAWQSLTAPLCLLARIEVVNVKFECHARRPCSCFDCHHSACHLSKPGH